MIDKILKQLMPVKEDNFVYYEISEKFQITINTIKNLEKIKPHSHEVDVWNYIFEGEITLNYIDKSEHEVLREGSWVFIPANKVHEVVVNKDVVILEFWKK